MNEYWKQRCCYCAHGDACCWIFGRKYSRLMISIIINLWMIWGEKNNASKQSILHKCCCSSTPHLLPCIVVYNVTLQLSLIHNLYYSHTFDCDDIIDDMVPAQQLNLIISYVKNIRFQFHLYYIFQSYKYPILLNMMSLFKWH